MKKEKNNKKIIIFSIVGVIIIAISLIGLYFINNEEYIDEVKKYEVVYEEKEARLNILNDISLPKIKADYLETIPLKKVKKDLSMQYIINIIKDYDKTFEVKDYTLFYDDVFYYFSLNYKIDDMVETTKKYIIYVKDNKVDHIVIGGVDDKEKLANLINFDKDEILKLVDNFKGDYKAKKIYEARKGLFKTDKVLNKDGTLDRDNMKIDVKELKETFLYDFQTGKLWYEATISTIESDENITDGGTIEVALN